MLTSNAISDIFDNGAEHFLTLEEEHLAIADAQSGDQDAKVALLYAYAPLLRSSVARYRNMTGTWSEEELRQDALLGFLEAIEAFDPERHIRLAGVAPSYVTNTLASSARSQAAYTVPERSLRRFFGILREADGDVIEAVKLAPQREMKPETFLSVLDAVRNVSSLDGELSELGVTGDIQGVPVWDGQHADAEDRILVEAAFRSVSTFEGDIVRLAYGFADYDPLPDAEVGHRLGLSRQKAQRTRTEALGKMRVSLGVAA